jgi:peptidoglycan/LPS O-acetylase OafA/YrhL
MQSNCNGKRTFEVLNGLRGIAAVAVVNAHLGDFFGNIRSANVGLVVDFFFLLSGFVLAHAYDDKLRSGMGTGRFMAARLMRLYPMYLTGFVVGAVCAWIHFRWGGNLHFFVTAGAGALFLPPPPALSSNDYNLFPLNFPAWSLFYELIANLVFACIARRMNNIVLGAVIVISFLALAAIGLNAQTMDLGVRPADWAGGLARVMFSFFAGIALYRMWRARPVRLNVHPVLLFALLILPLLFKPQKPFEWAYDLAAISCYFPLLLTLGAQSRPKREWNGVCAILGALSYPLYVIHAPVADWLRVYADKSIVAGAPWGGLLIVAGLASLAYVLEEKVDLPLRKALQKRLFAGKATERGDASEADRSIAA